MTPLDDLVFHHVGIACERIENEIPQYELIGFRREGEIFEDSRQVIRGLFMKTGSMQIELFEFERPRGPEADRHRPVNVPGIYHICFVVKDVDKDYQRLKAAGVPFHFPPQDFGIAKAAYGRDPDGNVFELLQWPTPLKPPRDSSEH